MKLDEPVDSHTDEECHDIIENLNNDQLFFMYSQACYPGAFDNGLVWKGGPFEFSPYDSIVEYLLTCEHGAFACVANTRYGFGAYSLNGPSQYYDREFWDAVFGENKYNIGEAFVDSRHDNNGWINEYCMRYVYYETIFVDNS